VRPATWNLEPALNLFTGSLQDFQGHIDLPLADIKGREEADHFLPATQEQEALLEGLANQPISSLPGVHLHGIHQADPRHVMDKGVFSLQAPQLVQEIISHPGLDFIGNDGDGVFLGQTVHLFHELQAGNVVTPFPLNGFEDDEARLLRVRQADVRGEEGIHPAAHPFFPRAAYHPPPVSLAIF